MKRLKKISLMLFICVVFLGSCLKNSKDDTQLAIENNETKVLSEDKNTMKEQEVIESNNLYVSLQFEEILKNTHSLYQARKDSAYNLFFIAGKYNSVFTCGNEVDFLSEEDLKSIINKENNMIEIHNRGIFRLINSNYSNNIINEYIVSNVFTYKVYSDGKNNLSIDQNNIFLNSEKYEYLLTLGFNQENIDTIRSGNSSYFIDVKETEVFLYNTIPDDYSFGKRGELVFDLKAIE